jgi:hypothetical protein
MRVGARWGAAHRQARGDRGRSWREIAERVGARWLADARRREVFSYPYLRWWLLYRGCELCWFYG